MFAWWDSAEKVGALATWAQWVGVILALVGAIIEAWG